MPATQTQIRRGTAAQCAAMTPASSEVIHDTTNNRLRAGNGVRAGGYEIPNFIDIQGQVFGYGSAGGSGNAITLTLAPALLAYAAGVAVEFKATANNSGATTIDINSLGTKNIYKMKNGTLGALESGDIKNGGIYRCTYDGTQFQIKALDEAVAVASGLTLLAVASGGGASYDFTSGFSSTYEAYLFIIQQVKPSTNTVFLFARTSSNGGSSYDSSGYDYCRSQINSSGTTTTVAVGASAAQVNLTNATTNTATSINGALWVHNFNSAAEYKQFTGLISQGDPSAGPFITGHSLFGQRRVSTAMNGLRFAFDSGNIASGGVIYMYGARKTV